MQENHVFHFYVTTVINLLGVGGLLKGSWDWARRMKDDEQTFSEQMKGEIMNRAHGVEDTYSCIHPWCLGPSFPIPELWRGLECLSHHHLSPSHCYPSIVPLSVERKKRTNRSSCRIIFHQPDNAALSLFEPNCLWAQVGGRSGKFHNGKISSLLSRLIPN